MICLHFTKFLTRIRHFECLRRQFRSKQNGACLLDKILLTRAPTWCLKYFPPLTKCRSWGGLPDNHYLLINKKQRVQNQEVVNIYYPPLVS